MDNIAHTLVGAIIGRSVGDRQVPAPAILGAVAANAPDWTELFVGPGLHRYTPLSGTAHRGVTHSLLGAGIQALAFTLVTGLVLLIARRKEDRKVPWGALLALYAAALASHLVMDWLGSYGLRPFLPWSNQRYYGDWVAIVDPFFWFVPLVLLAWGQTRRWPVALGTTALLAAFLYLVLIVFNYTAAAWLQVSCVLVTLTGVVGWHRHWFGPAARRAAAGVALLFLGAYTAAQAVVATVEKHHLRTEARTRFGAGATYALFTRPGYPFTWDPVMASADTVAGPGWSAPRHLDLPVVRRALATPDGAALAAFDRFVTADVDSTGDHTVVYLRETRRAPDGRRRGGYGIVVPASDTPRSP